MGLLAYNLPTSSLPLAAGNTIAILPASSGAGKRSSAFDVTSELRGLTDAQYVALATQAAGAVDYEWTDAPEYETGALRVGAGLGLQASIDAAQSREIALLQKQAAQIRRCMEDCLNGDVEIELTPAGPFTRTAAELNAAPAGTLKERITVRLKNADGINHYWARFALTIDLAEVVVDVDVGAPTINPTTVKLDLGSASFELIYDTDGGVTKIYASGDQTTAVVRVNTDDKLVRPVASKTLTTNVP